MNSEIKNVQGLSGYVIQCRGVVWRCWEGIRSDRGSKNILNKARYILPITSSAISKKKYSREQWYHTPFLGYWYRSNFCIENKGVSIPAWVSTRNFFQLLSTNTQYQYNNPRHDLGIKSTHKHVNQARNSYLKDFEQGPKIKQRPKFQIFNPPRKLLSRAWFNEDHTKIKSLDHLYKVWYGWVWRVWEWFKDVGERERGSVEMERERERVTWEMGGVCGVVWFSSTHTHICILIHILHLHPFHLWFH